MGYAMVVFEACLASAGFKRPMEREILGKLSKVMVALLGIYLVIRFADVVWRGAFALAFSQGLQSVMFWVENALFALPILLLWNPASRSRPQRQFVAAVAMVLAGFLYRINAYLVGYDTGPGWHYFPSFWEVMVTVGIIAFEILAYIVFVRVLPVLPADQTAPAAAAAK
jgi:Ni/Fe-hydrogenase subunit HybB-like protein